MDALEKKLNSKKLLSLKFFKNNFNLEANNINFNTNFDNDSPSNKILSLKILTFGHNCNFPGETPEEEFDEEQTENSHGLLLDGNANKNNKSVSNKKQEELEKKKKAEVVTNLADNKGKLLNKKIVILNKKDEGQKGGKLRKNKFTLETNSDKDSKKYLITDLKSLVKHFE